MKSRFQIEKLREIFFIYKYLFLLKKTLHFYMTSKNSKTEVQFDYNLKIKKL